MASHISIIHKYNLWRIFLIYPKQNRIRREIEAVS
ncbi:hypothetical protein EV689_101428 [Avibacterium gallinarum]|uniref:Uncharacterized protein n=1 Tax=Avibacterium gallinarum TaxID=755 RepID=A0A379AX31_AVIGA|nr:hypothetical protein EV689_101428 [Avibacterium gallinarum]SUB26897.1 Uncharacterised protein [Avibacterium gallinarum]